MNSEVEACPTTSLSNEFCNREYHARSVTRFSLSIFPCWESISLEISTSTKLGEQNKTTA